MQVGSSELLEQVNLIEISGGHITKEYLGEEFVLLDSYFRLESDGVFGFNVPAKVCVKCPLRSARAMH